MRPYCGLPFNTLTIHRKGLPRRFVAAGYGYRGHLGRHLVVWWALQHLGQLAGRGADHHDPQWHDSDGCDAIQAHMPIGAVVMIAVWIDVVRRKRLFKK